MTTGKNQNSAAEGRSDSEAVLGGDAEQGRLIQCTRCRHKHYESDRAYTKQDRYGMRTSICPRCRGQSYYQLGAA